MAISACVYSQSSIDLLTLSYRRGLPTDLSDGPGEAVEDVAFANVKLPIVLNERSIWYNDLTYQGSFVSFSSPSTSSVGLDQFILQTGLVQRFNTKQAMQVLFVPRLMSDLHQVDSRHFQLGGIGMFENKFSDQLLMRFGLMANRDLFGPMFVPLIYADWKISDKLSFIGLVPIYAKLNYQVNERVAVGLSQFGLITSYQMGEASYVGDYFERKSIDLCFFGRYQLVGRLFAEFRGGYAVGRTYKQFAADDQVDARIAIITIGDDRIQKNVSFDPGVILDFRVVYNLQLSE